MVLLFISVLLALLLLSLLTLAHPTLHPGGSDCTVKGALLGKWHFESGHLTERLFRKRGGNFPIDGVAYSKVGSAK